MKTMRSRCVRLAAVVAFALCGGTHAWAFSVGAFGDVGLINTETGNPSFRIDHIDMFASNPIDDRTRVLLEVEFRSARNEFEAQRYWIMRRLNEWLEVGGGRFHAPIGYWSRRYHHGKLMQPTVTRPFIIGYEGSASSFIPMHIVGAMAKVERGDGFLYEAWIANSNSIDTTAGGTKTLLVSDRTDRSDRKSLFAHMGYDVPENPIKPGISFMMNDVLEGASSGGLVGRGNTLVRQTLVGADLRYEPGAFELLTEFYALRNDAQPGVGDGAAHTAKAGFVQLGYHVNRRLSAWYRYERLIFDAQDAYFTTLLGRKVAVAERRNVYCLRYDLSESNALKLEAADRPRNLNQGGVTWNFTWEFLVF
jgi:hypothetical protein